MSAVAASALDLEAVTLVLDGRTVLESIDWSVQPGERWAVLGRNGSGKTSLVRIASLYLHPTAGTVRVLGETLGHTDIRVLRRRIGVSSASFSQMVRPAVLARDVVMTARHAALETWWHDYSDADRSRAVEILGQLGIGHLADQSYGTLSSGERQRVLLARTLMTDPGLLLLDEPSAGLDLGGREELISSLTELAGDDRAPATVLVTHHVEEIPGNYTHALLLDEGRVLVAGSIGDVLTGAHLSTCFGLAVDLRRDEHTGRFSANATG